MDLISSLPRYAIYFTPVHGSSLCQFGSAVIGYDCYLDQPGRHEVWPPLADLLAVEHFIEPRRYGFHATLRAPFELRPDLDAQALIERARSFAARQAPFPLPALVPQLMGSFVALACPAPPVALATLAADVVRAIEPLRAPLSEADRQRRMRAKLTPLQLAYVETWGYPYVFEEFVFHMTLTGNLPAEKAATALARLAEAWAPLAGPVDIDAITVLEQSRRDGAFRVLERIAFGGA